MVRHSLAVTEEHSARLIGIGGVVLVHLLLIGFVLSGWPKFAGSPRTARELFFVFLPKPRGSEPPPKSAAPPRETAPPLFPYPTFSPQTVPAFPPGTKRLDIPQLACAPEILDRLSSEDQARCAGASILAPDDTAVVLQTHVRDPVRRAAELAARKTPARLPCTFTHAGNVMVDPLCATGTLWRALRH